MGAALSRVYAAWSTDSLRRTPLARLIRGSTVRAVDVGSRGGFDQELLPIAWLVEAVGFEPDPDELGRLLRSGCGPWRSVRHLPYAIARDRGRRLLSIPDDPIGASLLVHDPEIGMKYRVEHLFSVKEAVEVETLSLDEALRRHSLSSPHYIKLDIEGAELEVLQGAPKSLESTVALKVEVAFIVQRYDQPLACDVISWLASQSFRLMEICDPIIWRTEAGPPHPFVGRGCVPYSRGQVAQADLVFLRDETTIRDEDVLPGIAIASALGYFDYARSIALREDHSVLGDRLPGDVESLLTRSSLRYGRVQSVRSVALALRGLVPLMRSAARGAG